MTTPTTTDTAATREAEHFDLIIIGSGSGNSIPQENEQRKIAIVERDRFGGTCLNVGCIPTKMYVYAADIALAAREAGRLGVDATVNNVDWNAIVDRVFGKRIDPISQGGEAYRRGEETPTITVFGDHATFVGVKLLQVGDKLITADQIVIAAGSRPRLPAVFANAPVPVYTNEDIMRLPKQPEHLIVVGGGFIAMEFAHVFDGLGTKVTVVNRRPELLRFADADISKRFTTLAHERFDVRLGETTQVEQAGSGVRLTLDSGETIEADAVLVATGRIPNGDQMNLEAAGVDIHDDGRIKVDDFGRTTADGIWALGDVSSPYMLKHVANAEMRAVSHNLLHPEDLKPMPHDLVPSAVFTHPQIACVGMTEQEAERAGYNITVKIQNYGDVAYGWAMEDHTGFCKLIADKDTGLLLGAHLIGPQAATLIHTLITAMVYRVDMRNFASDQYWIHPALPELIENAVLELDFSDQNPVT